MILWFRNFVILLIIFLFLDLVFGLVKEIQASTLNTSIQVVLVTCGDGVKDTGEDCDKSDFGGATCVSQGYQSGNLSCNANCTFNTSGCTSAVPSVSPGTGGGGYRLPAAQVILQGKAYPEATLTILKDGQIFIAGKTADSSGDFQIRISDISEGVYTFSFRAKDKEGRESVTFSVTLTTTAGATTIVSGIFIPPTIELDKTSLKKGEILNIFGQTAPKGVVSIIIRDSANKEIIRKTQAKNDGTWNFSFGTPVLEEGSYKILAKAVSEEGLISSFSKILDFYIKEAIPGEIPPEEKIKATSDINGDGRVDLIDFSILLYWWGKYNFSTDFNEDMIIDLIDFSIMMYHWSG